VGSKRYGYSSEAHVFGKDSESVKKCIKNSFCVFCRKDAQTASMWTVAIHHGDYNALRPDLGLLLLLLDFLTVLVTI
jgi:hypothetical protein